MLSQTTFKEFATQFRTTEMNIMREYLQNLFLSSLYQNPRSEKLAFKGGTALRLLFRSPRFSEDLDFSGQIKTHQIKTLLDETLQKIKNEAIPYAIDESKPTSGGYLAHFRFTLYGQEVSLELNLSLRNKVIGETVLVATPFIPHYSCVMLPIRQLVEEKMEALFRRKKPRDFFDLYFLLRERRGIDVIIPLKKKLLHEVRSMDPTAFKRELKIYLPVSHHQILSSFDKTLSSELERL